jgi:hypothetical protein
MGLAKSRLPRQQRHAQRATLNPSQQLSPQLLMDLGEIHL